MEHENEVLNEKDIEHTIIVRKIDQDLYEKLWALRKAKKAKSWKDMLAKVVMEYEQEVMMSWL
jgi:hypothetical protein